MALSNNPEHGTRRTRRPRGQISRPQRRPASVDEPVNRSAGATSPETTDDQPRIIEERRVIGPYGEEEREILDSRGRRFWSLRPQPAARYDVYGFGWFWWLIVWLIIFGLIVWGWGWGY